MITPAGTECPHYYEDFHRGRSVMECRLVKANLDSSPWEPKDCARCPVPAILRANGNPNMMFTLTIKKGFLGIGRKIEVKAFCLKHRIDIDQPPIGCPLCNSERPGMSVLFGEIE
jgi:hypothetical protein